MSATLSAEEYAKLQCLLKYEPSFAEDAHEGCLLLVTLRLDTLSPWSFKTNNIAQNCCLQKVSQLERTLKPYVKAPTLTGLVAATRRLTV